MSVLLEALKKAAEEKKRAQLAQEVSFDDVNALVADVTSEKKLGLKLQLSDSSESSRSDSTAISSEVDVAISEHTVVDTDTVIQTPNNTPTEQKIVFKIKEEASSSRVESEDLEELLNSATTTNPVKDEYKPGITPLDRIVSEVEDADIMEDVIVEDTSSNINLSLQPRLESSETLIIPSDKDSFEWSLETLPGYATPSQDKVVPSVKNSILMTGANSVSPKKKLNLIGSYGMLASLFSLLLLIGIGFYGLMYYQEQNDTLELSMKKYELAQRTVSVEQKPAASTPVVANVDEAASMESAQTNEASSLKVSESEASPSATTNVIAHSDVSSPVQEEEAVEDSPEAIEKPENSIAPKADSESKVERKSIQKAYKVPSKSAPKRSQATKPEPTKAAQSAIVIRTVTESELQQAYNAYEDGDFVVAEEAFLRALASEPKNKFALIGLASIAAYDRRATDAINYYQQVLSLDSKNLAAFEGIANLADQVELNEDWSRELADMAKLNPQSAILQKSIGNVFAKQENWLEAQQAYFKAYSIDVTNADNIVNLAISFDHLGKYDLASDYYTQGLAYADNQQVGFDAQKIKNRLVSLRQYMDKSE